MPRRRSDEHEDTAGSKILVKREPISRKPLIRHYDPVELLNRWEGEGKIKMTPAIGPRVLSGYEPEDLEEVLYYDVPELAAPANDSRYLRWLPRRRLANRLIDVTEILKPIVNGGDTDFLTATTILFPLGTVDIVSFSRMGARNASLFLDANARDRKNWAAGTIVVSRLPKPL
ncbi:MAG: hypothetical protein JWO84_240 [Parcubacteria group bacterium]|nr:hypothetical protein [Parcubacteria group bacterium]